MPSTACSARSRLSGRTRRRRARRPRGSGGCPPRRVRHRPLRPGPRRPGEPTRGLDIPGRGLGSPRLASVRFSPRRSPSCSTHAQRLLRWALGGVGLALVALDAAELVQGERRAGIVGDAAERLDRAADTGSAPSRGPRAPVRGADGRPARTPEPAPARPDCRSAPSPRTPGPTAPTRNEHRSHRDGREKRRSIRVDPLDRGQCILQTGQPPSARPLGTARPGRATSGRRPPWAARTECLRLGQCVGGDLLGRLHVAGNRVQEAGLQDRANTTSTGYRPAPGGDRGRRPLGEPVHATLPGVEDRKREQRP